MQESQRNLKNDIYATLAWAVVTPALAAWPFFSALPAFTLIGGADGVISAGVALFLFVSGFWGVASLAIFIAFISTDRARASRVMDSQGKGLKIGAYALAWTSVYFVSRYVFGL